MTFLFRIVLALQVVLLCASGEAWAQGTPSVPVDPGLPPSLQALLTATSRWSASAGAEGSFGFKDNLLLSSSAEERSAFARGEVEALVLRVPTGPLDYSFFSQAEVTRYFSGRTVDAESKAWLQTEGGVRFGSNWKLSLPITGYYYDQVFDVSDTDVERLVAELKVAGLIAGPTLRWSFRSDAWLETQVVGERKRYDDGINDGQVREGAFRLGWTPREGIELRLSGMTRRRNFDTRTQYSAAGRELFGTHLRANENEGEIRLNLAWDKTARWKTDTRVGWRDYRDNGSGYFNYREGKIDCELEWSGAPWFARLGGAARRVDFAVQTVGLGISPPPRIKDEYELALRLERKLSERWTVFTSYSWERSRSNDRVASYVVNEGLLGVRWSWEK